MSRTSARLPPTSRWMLTAMTAHRRSSLSMRSAMATMASSTPRPSRISDTTRWNSVAEGSDLLRHLVQGLEEAVAGPHRARQDRQHVAQLFAHGLLALAPGPQQPAVRDQ